MKHQLSILVVAPLFFALFSCGAPSENNKLIIGSWDGSTWLVNGKQSDMNAKDTHFTFNDKEEYTYDYAGTIEHGTYKVQNDKLYTKPTGEQEIMVKIVKLTKDSLVFDMNRGGQPESLTLLRK